MPFLIFGSGSFAVQYGDQFRSGIICGAISASFSVRNHLRFNLGIIRGPVQCSTTIHSRLHLSFEYIVILLYIKVLENCAGKDFHGRLIIIVHDLFTFPEVVLKDNKPISSAIFSVCEFP